MYNDLVLAITPLVQPNNERKLEESKFSTPRGDPRRWHVSPLEIVSLPVFQGGCGDSGLAMGKETEHHGESLEMLEMLIGSYWILDGDDAFDPITTNCQDRRKSRIQGGCSDLGLNQMVQTYSVNIL